MDLRLEFYTHERKLAVQSLSGTLAEAKKIAREGMAAHSARHVVMIELKRNKIIGMVHCDALD